MKSSEKKSSGIWTPSVGDKVIHRLMRSLGPLEVVGLGKEQIWPDQGVVRKVYWKTLSEEIPEPISDWTWDFALEPW
jgi:hypothetical protein